MPTEYNYELWNGKEVVGYFHTAHKIFGKYLIVPTISELKRHYNRQYEEIKVPVAYRKVFDDGVDITMRTVLDVRRKSKRQIEIMNNRGPA